MKIKIIALSFVATNAYAMEIPGITRLKQALWSRYGIDAPQREKLQALQAQRELCEHRLAKLKDRLKTKQNSEFQQARSWSSKTLLQAVAIENDLEKQIFELEMTLLNMK